MSHDEEPDEAGWITFFSYFQDVVPLVHCEKMKFNYLFYADVKLWTTESLLF